jgi:hypothetical protein
MDADDVCRPQRLARQLAELRAHPRWAGLGCRFRWLRQGRPTAGMRRYAGWQNSLVTPEEIRLGMFVEMPVTHATLMMRRDVLEAVGGYRTCEWSEDYDLVLRLLTGGHVLGKLSETLYAWREGERRLTRTAGHCSVESFHRARVFYLTQSVLAGQPAVSLWGVGRLGLLWKRSLEAGGLSVAYTPINPRRMKVSRGGREIIPPDALPRSGDWITLIACGTRSNRDLLRDSAAARGMSEGGSFWCVG